MTPDRAKFNKEVEKGLLDRGVNIPIRAMTEQETAEQRIKIQTDQIASLKRHIGRLETQLANELLVDDGSPLTPHGEAIAAGDGTLHGAIDYWQEQAFTMAAGQCCVKAGGLMADEHGHQYCDMERQQAELKRENHAIRTLMNIYNLGGWTDMIGPMVRAEKAESALAECMTHADAMANWWNDFEALNKAVIAYREWRAKQ